MSKLPIFNNGQLQLLVREPVLQDKRTEHVKFQVESGGRFLKQESL
jgi:HIV-1 Vpr-binding protein